MDKHRSFAIFTVLSASRGWSEAVVGLFSGTGKEIVDNCISAEQLSNILIKCLKLICHRYTKWSVYVTHTEYTSRSYRITAKLEHCA